MIRFFEQITPAAVAVLSDAELTRRHREIVHERKGGPQRLYMAVIGFIESEQRDSVVKQFSGGMKRRLEIARGLLHTPNILFLDEPTLGLDPQSRNQMWRQVRRMNEADQVTVFLTTHYMDEAERVAQRIAVIDRGRIVATGSSRELKKQTRTATVAMLQGSLMIVVCLIAGFRPAVKTFWAG